jgi:thioredoxin-like negative regulator of GroEL
VPQLAAQFPIQSLPTLIAWQGSRDGGHEVARTSGALPMPQFMQWIAQSYGLV